MANPDRLELDRLRRQVERLKAALRESETRFGQLAGNIDSVFRLYSLEEGKNLYISPAFERLWGVPLANALENPAICLTMVHPEDRARVSGIINANLADPGERLELEFRIVRPDGGVRWVQDSISGVRDEDGRFIRLAGITRDVTSLKKAELQVLESERRMRGVFEAAENVAFIMVEPRDQGGQIIEFSPGAEKMFGLDREEAVGRTASQLAPAAAWEEASGCLEGREGRIRNMEIKAARRSGEKFSALLSVYPLPDLSGEIYARLAVVVDVSELKIKDAALGDSREKYSRLVENSKEGVLVLSGLDVLFFNRRFLEFIGGQDCFCLERPIFDLVHPDDREMVKDEHNLRMAGFNWDYSLELRVLREDGEVLWLLADGSPIVWEGCSAALYFFTDISRQKNVEAELRRSQDTARALLNAVTETLILVEPRGVILDINETGARRLGGVPKDFIGLGINDVLPPEPARQRADLAARAAREGRAVLWEDERAGRYYSNSIYPAPDQEGRHPRLAIFARDVTAEKKAREQLILHQDQLRRMAAELTAAEAREKRRISDDLHNRIGQILFIAKMKLEALTWTSGDRTVEKTARELAELIGQALSDARNLMIEISPPILHVLGLEAALMDLGENIRDNHQLSVTVEHRRLSAPLSEDVQNLLYRAVAELTFNTVKHSRAENLKIAMSSSGGWVMIEVRDDGRGFDVDSAYLEAGKSNGFGLFSLRERLDAWGGRLVVSSGPGRGTWATVMMPVVAPAKKT
ncbi:MAG: PAS domain S-box protein [Pseudomonadota bacterium]